MNNQGSNFVIKKPLKLLSKSKQSLEMRSCNSERVVITYHSIEKQGNVFENFKPSDLLFMLSQLTRSCFLICVSPENC